MPKATTTRPTPARAPTSQVVVAAAGYGKSTLLERLALEPGALLLSAEQAQARAAGRTGRDTTLAGTADGPLTHLIIDDLDRLGHSDQCRLISDLAGVDSRVAVTIASRHPLLDDVRGLLQRPIADSSPSELCLSADEVADVLSRDYGASESTCAAVHSLTAGWPELVHLAGSALRARQPSSAPVQVSSLGRLLVGPSSTIASWLQTYVVDPLPAHVRAALWLLSWLGPTERDLVRVISSGVGDRNDAVDGLEQLEAMGLVLPARHAWGAEISLTRVVPILATACRTSRPEPPRHALRLAAQWYVDHDLPLPAAQAWQVADEPDHCIRTLIDHGDAILGAGGASELIELAGRVDDPPRALQLLVGEALRMTGDMATAHRTLMSTAPIGGPGADAALAWRLGMVHYARADYAAAVEVCDQAAAADEPTRDLVRVVVTLTCARFMLGQQAASEKDAERALALAAVLDDDRAEAAARLVSGLVTSGARRDDHLAAALLAAQRSGDANMAARVLLNQAGNLLVDANFRDAAEVAQRAVDAAAWGSPPATRASAVHNLGEALTRRGRFDAAAEAFRQSVRIYREHGLARTPAALWGLAEVSRQRGRLDEARASYAEVVDLVRDTGEVQVLVPALLGWVRCLGQLGSVAPEPEAPMDAGTSSARADELARVTAAHAAAQTCSLAVFAPALRTISGWVALCCGDQELAARMAEQALGIARGQRNRVALADALELAAAAAVDDTARCDSLTELEAIWRAGGANPSADHVLVRLARLPGAEPGLRADARAATRRLSAAGIPLPGAVAGESDSAADVTVRVLGPFEVVVNGQEVPHPAWRSRQARSLVKVLAAARGRPLTRDYLCETLWPDDTSDRTGHRLSVLLSAVRNVLDPDRRLPADHYLRTDLDAVRLDLRRVRLDLEELLRDAREAEVFAGRGQQQRARELLADVEATYRGEAFEDEPYEHWAEIPREEARAAWSSATRLAADLARRSGQVDRAIGHMVRLLSADAYDADAHRTLVDLLLDAGRHGEARRRLAVWTRAMRELGAPPPDHWLADAGRRRSAGRRTEPTIGHPVTA